MRAVVTGMIATYPVGGVVWDYGQYALGLELGGIEDHVHVLCRLGRTIDVAELVRELKRESSKWLKTKGAGLGRFQWQEGYGAFSVGASQVEAVRGYIARQEEHHRRRSFQDEFRAFLQKYGVDYDERYVWD